MELTRENIDSIAAVEYDYLLSNKISSKIAIQNKLCIEDVLLKYLENNENYSTVNIQHFCRFGRVQIVLKIDGEKYDPFKNNEDDEFSRKLLEGFTNEPSWSFSNGTNEIIIRVEKEKRRISSFALIVIGIILGIAGGLLLRNLCPDVALILATDYFNPVENMIMGLLNATASLMVFFSIISGVCGMGNIATFNKIGKAVITRFIFTLFWTLLVTMLISLPFFKINSDMGGSINFSEIFQMILNIIPKDIVSPFLTCNMLQIVFLAMIIGIAILILREKSLLIIDAVNQLNRIMAMIIGYVVKTMPIVVFLSVFNTIVTGNLQNFGKAINLPLLFILACVIIFLLTVFISSFDAKTSILSLIKKVLPSVTLGFTTSSSSAVFPLSKDLCENKLGISKNVVNMGLPLGQVIFKPAMQTVLFLVGICCAQMYNIDISISDLIKLFITSFLLGIATPPVPGAAISTFSIIFISLGIPTQAISIILLFDPIIDRIGTAINIGTLNLVLIQGAKKCNQLNRDNIC